MTAMIDSLDRRLVPDEADAQESPDGMGDFEVGPVGWRIYVEPIPVKDTHRGGIAKADETVRAETYLRQIGEVIAMGPLAYQDPRFQGRPWCQVGDMVIFPTHAGHSVQIARGGKKVQVKILHDDDILGTVESPDAVVTPI